MCLRSRWPGPVVWTAGFMGPALTADRTAGITADSVLSTSPWFLFFAHSLLESSFDLKWWLYHSRAPRRWLILLRDFFSPFLFSRKTIPKKPTHTDQHCYLWDSIRQPSTYSCPPMRDCLGPRMSLFSRLALSKCCEWAGERKTHPQEAASLGVSAAWKGIVCGQVVHRVWRLGLQGWGDPGSYMQACHNQPLRRDC